MLHGGWPLPPLGESAEEWRQRERPGPGGRWEDTLRLSGERVPGVWQDPAHGSVACLLRVPWSVAPAVTLCFSEGSVVAETDCGLQRLVLGWRRPVPALLPSAVEL